MQRDDVPSRRGVLRALSGLAGLSAGTIAIGPTSGHTHPSRTTTGTETGDETTDTTTDDTTTDDTTSGTADSGAPFRQTGRFAPAGGSTYDEFGWTLGFDGTTAIVGVRDDAGSAYIYERRGLEWNRDAVLTARKDDRPTSDWAVAVDGDTALVGAPGMTLDGDDEQLQSAGTVYVLVRERGSDGEEGGDASAEGWTQQAKLTADDADSHDAFGTAVALDGDIAAVGAPSDEDPNGRSAGAAYVFERDDGDGGSDDGGDDSGGDPTWTQAVKLTAENGEPYDGFGTTLAISDDAVVVGSPTANRIVETDDGADRKVENAGTVSVFERRGGEWGHAATVRAGEPTTDAEFGSALAIDGDGLLVGSPFERVDGEKWVGSVTAFERRTGSWTRMGRLTADDGDAKDNFGSALALADDTAVVTAVDDETHGEQAGIAYVFERDEGGNSDGDDGTGGSWTRRSTLAPEPVDADDDFGAAVALDGATALVGARGDEDPNGEQAGVVYVFDRAGTTPTPAPPTSTPTPTPTTTTRSTAAPTADTRTGSGLVTTGRSPDGDTATVGESGTDSGSGGLRSTVVGAAVVGTAVGWLSRLWGSTDGD